MWKALAGLLFFGVILVAPQPAWAQPCGGGRVPAPTLVAPAPDAQGVSLTPTLVVQPGTPLGREGAPRCVPWRAWFQVSTHPEFRQESIVFFGMLSAEDGGAIDRVTLPAGELRTNTRYHWRVAVSGKEEREGDPRGSPSGREVFSEYAPPRVFTTLPCHLPAAFNAAPADQAELLAPPTLRLETDGAAGAPTCQPNFTTWQVATDPGFAPADLVFNQTGRGANLAGFRLPEGVLAWNKVYHWRARFNALTGERGPWSQPTRFALTALIAIFPCNWGPLFNDTPRPGTFAGLAPTLVLSAGPVVAPACQHDGTQWQVALTQDFGPEDIVFDSGIDPGNLWSFPLPEGALDIETGYFWRARLHSTTAEPSRWSAPTGFGTVLLGQVFPVCLWPPVTLLSPADGAQGVALDPTFEVQIGGGAPAPMNCTLDGVRWQIALDEGFALNAVVFDTGSDAGVNTRFRPLLRIFVPGTTYHVRVQLLSDSGISNTWSDPSSFTTESDEVPPPPGPPEPPPQPPEPPPPPGPGVPALGCALDANANDRLDDDEILAAVRLWITGEVVPGASGRAIDDDAMLDFVRRWIGGEALGCAGPAGRR